MNVNVLVAASNQSSLSSRSNLKLLNQFCTGLNDDQKKRRCAAFPFLIFAIANSDNGRSFEPGKCIHPESLASFLKHHVIKKDDHFEADQLNLMLMPIDHAPVDFDCVGRVLIARCKRVKNKRFPVKELQESMGLTSNL